MIRKLSHRNTNFDAQSVVQANVSRLAIISQTSSAARVEDMTVSNLIPSTHISAPTIAPPSFITYERRGSSIPKAKRMNFAMVLAQYLHLIPLSKPIALQLDSGQYQPNDPLDYNQVEHQLSQFSSINDQLIAICKLNNDKMSSVLLEKYIGMCANVNSVMDSQHSTLMHFCAQRNKVLCMELLLHYGSTVDNLDVIQATPLFYACAHNCQDAAVLLLSNKANVHSKDIYASFPMMVAIKNQHYRIVELLLLFNADVHMKGPKGYTCLHLVAEQGNVTGLKFLIENCNASANRFNNEENNVLYLALPTLECVQYLCNQFNERELLKLVMHRNRLGRNAIHCCCASGYFTSLIMLIASLCRDSQVCQVTTLLNDVDTKGRTPLMLAVTNNRPEIVIFLCLIEEVNVGAVDPHGNTALHLAIQAKNKDITYLLLSIGSASKRAKNNNNVSCEQLAKNMDIDLKCLRPEDQTNKPMRRIPSQLAGFFTRRKKIKVSSEDSSTSFTETDNTDLSSLSSFPSNETITGNTPLTPIMDNHMRRWGTRFSETFSESIRSSDSVSDMETSEFTDAEAITPRIV